MNAPLVQLLDGLPIPLEAPVTTAKRCFGSMALRF